MAPAQGRTAHIVRAQLTTLATERVVPSALPTQAVSGKRSAVLYSVERASYLPSVLARKTESGLPLVTTLAGDGFFLDRVWSP